jgi:hypothetical protein
LSDSFPPKRSLASRKFSQKEHTANKFSPYLRTRIARPSERGDLTRHLTITSATSGTARKPFINQ